MGRLKKWFRNQQKLPRWIYFLPAQLLKLSFHCLFKFEVHDPFGSNNHPRGTIALAWHNRLLYMPMVFDRETTEHTAAMVSTSRDGQYLVDFVSFFHLRCVRGSSRKRGIAVQREALDALKDGFNVILTPDGPRGPKYRVAPGAVQLASVTGAPICPTILNYSKYWQLGSWDNFQIPKPGAKLTLEIGEPVRIPPDISKEETERYRQLLEERMLALTCDL
ncbi:MAG: lysophospholipid acyltransferase family protein [Victivallaceae bacterium]|nr:lysophospholipid acyltransferase family protein [Victivallaceae bacterium]